MKTRKKGAKLFAVLMSIMMIFTMMPSMAFATEAGQSILELCTTEGCEYAAGHEGNCSNVAVVEETVSEIPFTVANNNMPWEIRATDTKYIIKGVECPLYEVKIPTGSSGYLQLKFGLTNETEDTGIRKWEKSSDYLNQVSDSFGYTYLTLPQDGAIFVAVSKSENFVPVEGSFAFTFIQEAKWDPVGTVNKLIDAINDPVTLEDRANIEKAISDYASLTDAQKNQITDYIKLQQAETALQEILKAEAERLIDAIGTVQETKESVDKVVSARTFYDGLNETQQGKITNLQKLLEAEAQLKEMLPVIVKNLEGNKEYTLPENNATTLSIEVDTHYIGEAEFSAEWFSNTEASTEGAKPLGEGSYSVNAQKGNTTFNYTTKQTSVTGTLYYYCVVTDAKSGKSEQSDYVSVTVKEPAEKVFGVIVGEESIGSASVTIEDKKAKRSDLVNMMGEPMEDIGPAGDMLRYTNIPIYPSDTMMTIIARACLLNDITQTGAEQGYISKITRNSDGISRAEFQRGAYSGWMGTLDEWFTSEGFDAYTVANGAVKDGTYIKLMYTLDLGKDLGQDVGNTDRSLNSLSGPTMSLQPKFNADQHDYLVQNTASIDTMVINATAASTNYMVRIFADGIEYRSGDAIPVSQGTKIQIYCSKNAYGEVEQAAIDAGYTLTVVNPSQQSLLGTGSSGSITLKQSAEDGTLLAEITPTFTSNGWAGSIEKYAATLGMTRKSPSDNPAKVTVQLNGVAEDVTAKIIDLETGTEQTFSDDKSVVIARSFAKAGNHSFHLIVGQGEKVEYYFLELKKNSNAMATITFTGSNAFKEIINGEVEGTVFQLDAEGKETGEIGPAEGVHNYNVYLGMTQSEIKMGGFSGIAGNGNDIVVTLKVDGVTKVELKNPSNFSKQLKKNAISINKEKTDLTLTFDYGESHNYDDLEYTFHVYRVSVTAADFEAKVNELPDVADLQYSRDGATVDSLKDLYENKLDNSVKEQVSSETVEKLNAAATEITRQHDAGMAMIAELKAQIDKFKDVIKADTKITSDIYAQYGASVKAAKATYDSLNDWILEKFNNEAGYKTALNTAYDLIRRYSIAVEGSNGKVTDYLDDFMVSSNHYNLTMGEEAEIVFRDFISSGDRDENCLPYNTPGTLVYQIEDESIVKIREELSTYKDLGLGGGGNYNDLRYYLVPQKAGTTTLNVTLADEEGTYYGQIPQIVIHVNNDNEASIEDLDAKLTNIYDLEKTTKYDTWYYWEGTEGAPFTFKVNGDNAKVVVYEYNGDGRTEYEVSEDGTVTVLLKDGYNPIEVTADYEGKTVTQVYGIKGKVISYTIENKYRPGEALREGDTAIIKITGLSRPVYKILRIYNPSEIVWAYDTVNLPGQGYLRAESGAGQYSMGSMEVLLTGSGQITLTNGHIEEKVFGSALYSEGGQGNTGGIAAQGGYIFSVIPDLTFTVAEHDGIEHSYIYSATLRGGTEVVAGSSVTVEIAGLPLEEIKEAHPFVTDNYNTVFKDAKTTFSTTIPGLETVESETANKPNIDREASYVLSPLETVTFIVPEDTPAGTYKIHGGYVIVRFGTDTGWVRSEYLYRTEIADIEIKVVEENTSTEPDKEHEDVYTSTGEYLNNFAKKETPTVGSTGGEWQVIGLARSGREIPEGYDNNVVTYVKKNINDKGQLHEDKSTDNSRIILALTAAGYDVTNVGGHNLLDALSSYSYAAGQGNNAAAFALIAFDSYDYEIPENTNADDQTTRDKLIAGMLANQCANGGWSITGKNENGVDIDTTAMVVQALAPYYSTKSDVKTAVDKALDYLSSLYKGQGFVYNGEVSSEAYSQVIVALTALGINPETDIRFVKDGVSVVDALCDFYVEGGGFKHTADGNLNMMATEQGFYALVSYMRLLNNAKSLYDMTDVTNLKTPDDDGSSGDNNNPNPDNPGVKPEEGDGYVIISFEDNATRKDGDTFKDEAFKTPFGTIISATRVPFKEGETIADVTVRFLTENGYTYTYTGRINNNFYLATITGPGTGNKQFGEFSAGRDSGWMITQNGVFINASTSDFKVKDGDVIEWQYTCQLGRDIGDPYWDDKKEDEEVKDVTTSGGAAGGATGEPVTTTTPTEVTVSGSTATATVTKENVTETIKQATENKAAEIVVQVTESDTKGAANVKVQLDTTTVKDVVNKTEAALTVKTENATVTLDRETLKTVATEATGSTVTLEVIEVAAPTVAHKEAAGENGHVIQLVIKSGDKTISSFNEGKATVTVEIPSKLTGKKVAAIHIGDDGKIEHLKGQEVTVGGKKHYRFDTPHFSTFALVDADEIGLEVEEETMSAEEVKALIADLTPVARSSKTAKKNIKVTVKLDKADKAIIEELEAEGFTVKYNFYRSTKKASKYSSRLIKDTTTYTQTGGKKGTKYYYKVRVQVYDAEGKLIARTALKQCRYASRTWSK